MKKVLFLFLLLAGMTNVYGQKFAVKFLSKNMENYRYQGNLYGAGLSYGYQWLLSNRWSMEAVIGVGWAHLDYDKYPCASCGTVQKSETKDYFGVTKAALSIIYFIK